MENKDFTFFWSGPFSNFYTTYFVDSDNISYNCSEQYYMAKKALFFKDFEVYKLIMDEKNPKNQKKLARTIKNYSDKEWYGGSIPAKKYMFEGNFLKYSQNEKLKNLLLETSPTRLVEASPYDTIWGVGLSEQSILIHSPSSWRGKNWLGDILTEIREKIKREEKKFTLF
jgi:ribA/ribD-fused uncharacterized protein